jgi:hypothetical protein
MTDRKITRCALTFEWDDRASESMYDALPEYLRIEIDRYLEELVDLRNQEPEHYAFINEKGIVK